MRPLPLYSSLGNIFAFLEWQEGSFDLHNFSAHQVKKRLSATPDAHGLLVLIPSHIVQVYIFNADGSYGEFSGNGARIIAHLLMQKNKSQRVEFRMGQKIVQATQETHSITLFSHKGHIQDDVVIELADRHFIFHRIDTGNPHALFFDDMTTQVFAELAPTLAMRIDHQGINLSLLKKIDTHHYHLTPFERGVGLTPACSSAAIAFTSWLAPTTSITLSMPGGSLTAALHDITIALTAEWPHSL